MSKPLAIHGCFGHCGARPVFLGFAPASTLYSISFADVLDEETGNGYQRRFSEQHSLDFRRYIQKSGATTIPLTFNLRQSKNPGWKLLEGKNGTATLHIPEPTDRILTQVDCQHRLGYLKDLPVPLAFMTFIGLSIAEEMEVFRVINSEAKGLNSSLLDFHESKLPQDLSTARPEIYIALKLNQTPESPWFKRLDLGGKKTVGMKRHASLRTMQKAVRRFLRESHILENKPADDAAAVVHAFWIAITKVMPNQWNDPRKHFITKGIGVYCLMSIAGDLYRDSVRQQVVCDESYFIGVLSDFVHEINWSNSGDLKGLGGAAGADRALEILRKTRTKQRLKVVNHGE